MRGERALGGGDLAGDVHHDLFGHAALRRRVGGGVLRVRGPERPLERLEGDGRRRIQRPQRLPPVRPAPNVRPVREPLGDEHVGHREDQRGLRARMGRDPPVRHARRVR
ncbi:MAG: hypothetical protein ACK559_40710, partial [bacterium]